MLSLFLGIVLVNLGFIAGSWFKGEMLGRQMNTVLRYDKERMMWREIHNIEAVSLDMDMVIGIKLIATTETPPEEQ